MTYYDTKAKRAAHSANVRRWRERNPEEALLTKERRAANRQRNRDIITAAKDVPCMDCGVRYPPFVMDFDHRDPATKVRGVGSMQTSSVEMLMAEIEKCDVVCSNCHRVRTYG